MFFAACRSALRPKQAVLTRQVTVVAAAVISRKRCKHIMATSFLNIERAEESYSSHDSVAHGPCRLARRFLPHSTRRTRRGRKRNHLHRCQHSGFFYYMTIVWYYSSTFALLFLSHWDDFSELLMLLFTKTKSGKKLKVNTLSTTVGQRAFGNNTGVATRYKRENVIWPFLYESVPNGTSTCIINTSCVLL